MPSHIACAVHIDTSEVDEINEFIERNRDRLAQCPVFTKHLTSLMNPREGFIFLTDERGLRMEPSMKMILAITSMRRAGCT